MIKRLTPSFVILAIAFATMFSGCKKYVHQNMQAASNSSVAIIAYNNVFAQVNAAVDSALDQKTVSTWKLSGSLCANVTLEPLGAAFPKTLTIDYGTNCIGHDGKDRAGKIVAQFSGNLLEENTTVVLSFDEFVAGQYALSGTDSITNTGTDNNGNPVFTEVLRNTNLTWGTQQIKWQANLTRVWQEGSQTNFATDTFAGLNDDVFALTGSASGNDANAHPFSLEIKTPLVLQTGCQYIKEGTLLISPANYHDGLVDYGNGACDKQATIEVEGEVFNFTM